LEKSIADEFSRMVSFWDFSSSNPAVKCEIKVLHSSEGVSFFCDWFTPAAPTKMTPWRVEHIREPAPNRINSDEWAQPLRDAIDQLLIPEHLAILKQALRELDICSGVDKVSLKDFGDQRAATYPATLYRSASLLGGTGNNCFLLFAPHLPNGFLSQGVDVGSTNERSQRIELAVYRNGKCSEQVFDPHNPNQTNITRIRWSHESPSAAGKPLEVNR
jgi:hypothetical protein